MKAKLKDALKSAIKAKDKLRLETIRGLLSEIQYDEIKKQVEELSNDDILGLVQREIKKRQESIEYAEKGNRIEMRDKLKNELQILEGFLPKQLSSQELEKIISGMRASNPELNMGAAMKLLKESYAGQFDGRAASEIAKRILASVHGG